MTFEPVLVVGAYMLIGIFVASVVTHMGYNDDGSDFFLFVLCTLFWPIVICGLLGWLILAIPYILGKWIGYLLHDLMR